ncbi:MAG: ISL3 family transposase [Leptolyngbya sp. UWPOB_LEPTO1]|uniref:ISL3 family transposase n=1 Tax=Leptolyngbya sp. UWPOB_LEPTO1 TaxID=2815653 RepID=UPI001ACEA1B4|nr:ISL3 family transposase [Leptolyngbya sp. UWPOB_LEPTO1]MBN8560193.1 ISL3 family transposase [Leptolyngbya sp. UWPOB_LEPTO1]
MQVDVSELRRLGIDEIALRKGQKDFVVVLVDLDRNALIGMAPSRKQVDIQQVLDGWGSEILNQIVEVSIDLSGNYRGLVQKQMPNAQIVADRFHVMQLMSKELNTLRNQEIRAIAAHPDEAERTEMTKLLKSSKYALLKPEANLTDKQKATLERVKLVSPTLAHLHQQKEAFRDIFETAIDWEDGMIRLAQWLAQAQTTFQESVATIDRWFEEVSNYFEHHTTSGAVEGINNKLKLIKRSGYGFRNFANFELRCLICWHLDLTSA